MHSAGVPDQRLPHQKLRNKHAKLSYVDPVPDAAYDRLLHPFYATALIDGRRVFLNSNDTVIILDIASGRWTIEAESP